MLLGSRNLERGQKAVEELKAAGIETELVQIDVGDQKSIAAACEDVKSKLNGQPLWGLVNNAGLGLSTSSDE